MFNRNRSGVPDYPDLMVVCRQSPRKSLTKKAHTTLAYQITRPETRSPTSGPSLPSSLAEVHFDRVASDVQANRPGSFSRLGAAVG